LCRIDKIDTSLFYNFLAFFFIPFEFHKCSPFLLIF
jgi:hypothetical protein